MKNKKPELLTRKEFRKQVFERDEFKCVFCGKAAVDPHHILDRSLFDDEGYYLSNGVSVCSDHHWSCEQGLKSPEQIREIAKITEVILPPGFDPSKKYTKFGEVISNQ
jgi:predicted restriction endonuclease